VRIPFHSLKSFMGKCFYRMVDLFWTAHQCAATAIQAAAAAGPLSNVWSWVTEGSVFDVTLMTFGEIHENVDSECLMIAISQMFFM
jgi:hypothetical protein